MYVDFWHFDEGERLQSGQVYGAQCHGKFLLQWKKQLQMVKYHFLDQGLQVQKRKLVIINCSKRCHLIKDYLQQFKDEKSYP